MSCITAPIFAVVPFAVPSVFGLVLGPAQAEQMLLPSTLLAVGFYMNSTLNMPYILSLAVGKPEIALALNAWALAAVLPSTVLLIWRWGLTGAALSWVVYHAFAYLYLVPRICRECAGGGTWRWYLDVARFFIPAVAIYGIAWFTAVAVGQSAAALGLAYGVGTAVYTAAGWKALSANARDRVRSILLEGTFEYALECDLPSRTGSYSVRKWRVCAP